MSVRIKKKIKMLYRYSNLKINKHPISNECNLDVSTVHPHGIIYRCRHLVNDFYGYATLKEAKKEEILETVEKIGDLIQHWEKLTKKKWPR